MLRLKSSPGSIPCPPRIGSLPTPERGQDIRYRWRYVRAPEHSSRTEGVEDALNERLQGTEVRRAEIQSLPPNEAMSNLAPAACGTLRVPARPLPRGTYGM